jgi:DNA-binding NarL/FixJ family response regulator
MLAWAVLVTVHGVHAAGLLVRPAAVERALPSRPESKARPALERLTERERQVIGQLARGRSNKQIALALGISERTARTHVSNILLKLGLASRTEAALLAAREGATQEPPTD